ncbi:MAG: hypothetical protein JXA43_03735 [Candidatus Diapherotrites archaeon]|nr:hypothetical protein [Candidatus Diapherotrites archaeon]
MAKNMMQLIGFLLLGMGVGRYIPGLPEPLNVINPWIGIILIIIGIFFLIKNS